MDITEKFVLGDEGVTLEQKAFFDEFGFIHFKNYFSTGQIEGALDAIAAIEKEWINASIEKINGIPIKYGKDENGRPIVQRFAFSSLQSEYLHQLLQDERIQSLKRFLGEDARIAENEKDGLVINHYVNTGESNFTKLGWHTDGLRDLFTQFKLEPMLNVGIYLDDSPKEKGSLRIIPGTHKQGLKDMLLRKKYFVDNTEDPDEFIVEASAGDLTVHSGRLWHRVALASVQGRASVRRVMYFPIIKGKFKPKTHRSPTPIYHKLNRLIKS
ncbi:MAG TPA: phytanoyl-CoA dioxygenase family protein [Chitinophagaceae bacterium]|jgi:ectoine hydroxylase-related dioxygenase (phytanoyl-CoA dioxygenase family)|nr:phytanoyl-CoA dioxygenase family protein [Chitinophagaceae bacterium]